MVQAIADKRKVRLMRRLSETGRAMGAFFTELPTRALSRHGDSDGAAWILRETLTHIALADGNMWRVDVSIKQMVQHVRMSPLDINRALEGGIVG